MTVSGDAGEVPSASWSTADVRAILRLLLRRWRVIVACCVAGMVVMFGVMVMQGPRYEINAKILVQLGHEMMPSPLLGNKDASQVMPVSLRPEDSASEIEILTDPNLIRQTVESLGADFFLSETPPATLLQKLKAIPRAAMRTASESVHAVLVRLGVRPETTPLQRVMLALQDALDIESVRKSDVIGLTLTFPDPDAGVIVLDRFMALAQANHVKAHHVPRERAMFGEERSARNVELLAAQQRLLDIQGQRYAAWLAPEQRAMLLRTVADLELQRAQAFADAAQTAAEIDSLQEQLTQLPREVQTSSTQTRNKSSDDLAARLLQLRLDLAGLLTRYAPQAPDVIEAQRQIDAVSAALAAEPPFQVSDVTTGISPQHEEFARQLLTRQNLLAGQRARAVQIGVQLDGLHQQLRDVQTAEIEVDRLQRDIVRLHRLIEFYDSGIDDARLADAMEASDISDLKIIMPPTADLLPKAPSIKRFVLLGFVGGLVLGVAAVLLQDYAAWVRRDRMAVAA